MTYNTNNVKLLLPSVRASIAHILAIISHYKLWRIFWFSRLHGPCRFARIFFTLMSWTILSQWYRNHWNSQNSAARNTDFYKKKILACTICMQSCTKIFVNLKKIKLWQNVLGLPGIEPGPAAWQPTMLANRLSPVLMVIYSSHQYHHLLYRYMLPPDIWIILSLRNTVLL